ncbi:MAG TPA: adenylate kinase [Candidatus Limnocylindrales bacterium]
MRIIVLLGAPGSGKGTQAAVLEERLGIPHIATGDLFRAAAAEGTPVGEQAAAFMARGELVPDGVTIAVLEERLNRPDAARGAILDGFPRTRAQAQALDQTLERRAARIDRALYIEVPSEDLAERLSGRWICQVAGHVYHQTAHPPKVPGICDIDGSPLIQREDDRMETIQARLARQLGALAEVVDYYRQRGVLRAVDGRRPIDEVSAALLAVVDVAPAGDG